MEMTYAYIPKDFAEQIKAAADDKVLQEQVIQGIIQHKYNEIKYEMDILDEQVLKFKLVGLQFQKTLDAEYEIQEKKLQTLIDNVSDQYSIVRDKAKEFAKQLHPLTNEVNGIVSQVEKLDKRLADMNTYRLKDMLDIVERIANLDEKAQKVLIEMCK